MRPSPFGGSLKLLDVIERIVRDVVIHDWTEFTPQGAMRTGVDWGLVEKALSRLRIYNLVQGGLFTYEMLGIPVPIPDHIMMEHIIISGIYAQARKEKRTLDKIGK